MRATALLLNRSLIQTLRQTLDVPTKTQPICAFLFTQIEFGLPRKASESEQEDPVLSYRIEKLGKGEPVLPAFQGWMRDGFPIRGGDIFHTINRLRKLKKHKRALEVMEWVIRERPYKPIELDYSYLLEFTSKVHGVSEGEKLFSRIPLEFQNELLYNNLVLACLDKGLVRRALEYMKKMREKKYPISHLVFNRLIIINSSECRAKSIPKILAQMKADGITPHVSTYNILMKLEANKHDIAGLMKVFGNMKSAQVEPDEVSYSIVALAHVAARLYTVAEFYIADLEKSFMGKNWSTLDILLMLYGHLRKVKELERTWRTVKGLPFVRSKSYVLAIEALGRIGEIDRAEELLLEVMSREGPKTTELFNAIISVYCRQGLVKKASSLYREIESHGLKPVAMTYRYLALGCLRAGLVTEASKTLTRGSDLKPTETVRNSISWLETTLSLIEAFAEKGDIGNSEKLFEELRIAKYSRHTFVYNALFKAFVNARVHEPCLLKRMILDGARPDSESYSLFELTKLYRT